MSYDSVRERLSRFRDELEQRNKETAALMEALEQLTAALESDMAQIKGALSHIADLLEQRGPH